MNIDRFWTIVDAAREAGGVDPDARIAALRDGLANASPEELASFDDHYQRLLAAAHRWDLWAAAYVMNAGRSDDGFRYFRDWLISEGRKVFEGALCDPESLADLPKVEHAENELYGYVAIELHEEAGAGEIEGPHYNEAAEPAGEPWEEDDVDSLYPRLAKKYS